MSRNMPMDRLPEEAMLGGGTQLAEVEQRRDINCWRIFLEPLGVSTEDKAMRAPRLVEEERHGMLAG
ncbi:hypothetical protein L249_1898 [Ophiocordyceps polyrhachis-furcata BCC 54312]|uniref:Uncharacterized protein n=1 Tax=Ophiocordyceps polyrhachis-furcata BCC 54312 TaxID=1330021 RepID=A0A367LRN9_9HYPO|nr:hypothetical protein L249_1898 [Ophiocordyceps polyrhachis-furcata BCC 54312]